MIVKPVVVLSCIASLCLASQVAGQTAQPPDPQKQALKAILQEAVDAGTKAAELKEVVVQEPFGAQVAVQAQVNRIAAYLVALDKQQASQALMKLMDARVDKQVAAAPASDGGTSMASKGTVPAILGVAVENGALIKAVSGTTVTFRGNPTGIIKTLQGKGLLNILDDLERNQSAAFAAKFSFAASFDTSRGVSAGTLLANSQQLSSWSVRYEIHNERNAASMEYSYQWATLASQFEPAYGEAVVEVGKALTKWKEFDDWNAALRTAVRARVDTPLQTDRNVAAAAKTFGEILTQEFSKLDTMARPAEVTLALNEFVARLTAIMTASDKIYKFASKGQLATIDWTTKRDPQQPDLYTLTGVWETGLGVNRENDLTVNGAMSFYRSEPTASSHRFKKGELTTQYDRPLGRILIAPFVLTLAAKYQYLPNDTPASTVDAVAAMAAGIPTSGTSATAVAPKGHLGIVQAKLTIPVKGGVKIPLSLTAANRTELIKEKDVRANFGLTFDLDALMAGAFGK